MKTFRAELPASKSVLIRLLLIESYSELPLIFYGSNGCQDVLLMRKAVAALKAGETTIDCGESAALLRFLALKVSRQTGSYALKGSLRLMQREHGALLSVLAQLGVEAEAKKDSLVLKSKAWVQPSKPLDVDTSLSSQVLSAVLLNSWKLGFDLHLKLPRHVVSAPYLYMSLEMLKFFSLQIDKEEGEFLKIPLGQKPLARAPFHAEIDMSSAFAIAALGVAGGEAFLDDFPDQSLQGDFLFPAILKRMGATLDREGHALKISKPKSLKGIDVDLKDMPDLLPVLAVLCAHAETPSKLYGVPHLKFKETNRLESTAELLKKCGAQGTVGNDSLEIRPTKTRNNFVTDVSLDHRLAMAAAVCHHFGHEVKISGAQSVKKSFPSFWDFAQLPLTAFES